MLTTVATVDFQTVGILTSKTALLAHLTSTVSGGFPTVISRFICQSRMTDRQPDKIPKLFPSHLLSFTKDDVLAHSESIPHNSTI